MGSKVLKVFLGLVVLVLILAGVGYYMLFYSGVTKAQLNVESGEVLVNGEVVQSYMELSEGDVIETGADGLATVILYDSVVIDLESGTKISLDELTSKNPRVSQEGGETWNTFTKLSGVEAYSLRNGETIASVRGTSFRIRNNYIFGGDGNVSYSAGGREFSVSPNSVVEVVDGIFISRDATPEEIARAKMQMEKAVRDLQRLRMDILKRSPRLVSLIKGQTGMNEEELMRGMREIDEGRIDIDEVMARAPARVNVVKRLEEITRAIIKIRAKMDSLNG